MSFGHVSLVQADGGETCDRSQVPGGRFCKRCVLRPGRRRGFAVRGAVHVLPSGSVQSFSVPPQEPFPIMGQEYAYHVAGTGRGARITAPYIEV